MISKNVYQKLTKKGLTIAFAESMTGGALCAELIKNPGASNVITSSIIAYSNEQKINLLNIQEHLINTHGVVSSEIADHMAFSIRDIAQSDIGVGITGNAGPSYQLGSSKKEAYISIVFSKDVHRIHLNLTEFTRIKAIDFAVKETYLLLEKLI